MIARHFKKIHVEKNLAWRKSCEKLKNMEYKHLHDEFNSFGDLISSFYLSPRTHGIFTKSLTPIIRFTVRCYADDGRIVYEKTHLLELESKSENLESSDKCKSKI